MPLELSVLNSPPMYIYIYTYVYIYYILYIIYIIYICMYKYMYMNIYYIYISFSGEYHMYQFIPLQRDYLCETSLKANVATDEGKDQNET